MAQKIGLLRPFEVLNVFGGKSISLAPRAFKFGEKRVSIEMHKWWNFGVDISNHFFAIWPFCLFNSLPTRYKNSFWKLFLYVVGKELEEQNGQIRITQKWLEISTPKFHQLLTSMKTRFVPKIKVIGAQNLDFPPKTSKTSNGCGGPNFWAMPLKFGENWYWPKL